MNWKKDLGKRLLITGNVIFWVSILANFFDSQLYSPPDYFYEYQLGMTAVERQVEFMRVEKVLYWKILANTIHLFFPFMILVYGNWFILVKNYLMKQRYWGYIWRLLAFLFVLAFILSYHPELNHHDAPYVGTGGKVIFHIPKTIEVMTIGFWIILFTTPLYLSFDWFKQNTQLANLKSEKLETELSFLKSQINPHFFFNTLNNLYALTLENSKAAPEVILKLSNLMRYTIYDGKETAVFLEQEVTFIENYLELQKIRLHKKSEITFQQNIGNPKLVVPPLLFVIFLENAFKHG
ncbi:MAG: sensor histidine kinase, partial [Saprospiraceae bacterium]